HDDSRANPLDLWEKNYTHQNDEKAVSAFRGGNFHITRKSPSDILAVRRKVYDNDHQPADLVGVSPPRWSAKPGDSWQLGTRTAPKRFKHAAGQENTIAWLRYRHLPATFAIDKEGLDKLKAVGSPETLTGRLESLIGKRFRTEEELRTALIGRTEEWLEQEQIKDPAERTR